VWSTEMRVPPLAHDPAIPNQDGTDQRIGRRLAPATQRQFERPLHEAPVVHASSSLSHLFLPAQPQSRAAVYAGCVSPRTAERVEGLDRSTASAAYFRADHCELQIQADRPEYVVAAQRAL